MKNKNKIPNVFYQICYWISPYRPDLLWILKLMKNIRVMKFFQTKTRTIAIQKLGLSVSSIKLLSYNKLWNNSLLLKLSKKQLKNPVFYNCIIPVIEKNWCFVLLKHQNKQVSCWIHEKSSKSKNLINHNYSKNQDRPRF